MNRANVSYPTCKCPRATFYSISSQAELLKFELESPGELFESYCRELDAKVARFLQLFAHQVLLLFF